MVPGGAFAFFKSAARMAAIPVIAVIILSTARSFSFGLLLLLLLFVFLIVLAALILFLMIVVTMIWNRQWMDIARGLLAFILFCLLAIPAWWAGDYVHLAVGYPVYVGKFLNGGRKPVSVLWSSEGFVPAGCDRYMLYDPLGQDRAKDGRDGPDYWITTRRLVGSFYIREKCW